MGIASDLRESVLQAAIQGKLTEQLATDGNARDLLKQIKAEKDKLIADKKIKKEKALAPISDDEKPFDIPDGWEWCRLGELVSVYGGKRIPAGQSLSETPTGHKYIRVADMQNGTISLDNIKYISDEIWKGISRYTISSKDLYITVAGTIGRVGLVPDELDGANLTENADKLVLYCDTNKKCLLHILNSPYMQKSISDDKTQNAQPKLAIDKIQKFIIPLPPLPEQERIVAKVDELMKEIDELEKIENELESIKKAFPDDMKSALLQAAMKGELTERLATDGTAKELLDKIGVKPIADTSDMPFDIPDGWEWVQFGDIVDFQGGKTPPRAEGEWWSDDYRWVSIADMPENGTLMTTKEGISAKALKDKFGNKVSKKGTLIMSFKLTVGRVSILGIDAVHNEAIISIYPKLGTGNTMRDYFFKILPFVTTFGDSKNAIKGKTLNRNSIYALPIPLPPLPEQERIVAQLDKLLPLCESLS